MIKDPTIDAARDMEDIRRGAAMHIDVRTQGGQKLLQLTEALLADRIEKLVQADAYCTALLEILSSVGYNIQLAAGKSAKLMRQQAMGE